VPQCKCIVLIFFIFKGLGGVKVGEGGTRARKILLHTDIGVENAAGEIGNPPALTSEITSFFVVFVNVDWLYTTCYS